MSAPKRSVVSQASAKQSVKMKKWKMGTVGCKAALDWSFDVRWAFVMDSQVRSLPISGWFRALT
jgi:hypothetical protein